MTLKNPTALPQQAGDTISEVKATDPLQHESPSAGTEERAKARAQREVARAALFDDYARAVAQGADLCSPEGQGPDLLSRSVALCDRTLFLQLLAKGVQMGGVSADGVPLLHALLGPGLDAFLAEAVDKCDDLGVRDARGRTVLHRLAARGNAALAAKALDRGVDPMAVDGNGRMPIHVAATRRKGEAFIRLMAEKKMDLNIPDANGHTPAVHAMKAGRVENLRALIALGADNPVSA